jgi:hypothetical protein
VITDCVGVIYPAIPGLSLVINAVSVSLPFSAMIMIIYVCPVAPYI